MERIILYLTRQDIHGTAEPFVDEVHSCITHLPPVNHMPTTCCPFLLTGMLSSGALLERGKVRGSLLGFPCRASLQVQRTLCLFADAVLLPACEQ